MSRGPAQYHRLEKLGRGSFATVYRAVHVQTNQEAAIKHIYQEKLTLKLQENLESEISILKNHSHRNIVRLYDIERHDKHIYIVLEYCRGGDLQKFIKIQPGARLTEATSQQFMRHLAAGLRFLNDRNLVHRDIKPQNLLLTEKSIHATLKIADFGFARHLEGATMAETLCGSPLYMAPEILSQTHYNAKADLWSVGAVLFEMAVGRPPFAAQNQVELLKVIKRPLQIPSDIGLSVDCVSLLQGLLRREPLERISFQEFFQSNFLDVTYSQGFELQNGKNAEGAASVPARTLHISACPEDHPAIDSMAHNSKVVNDPFHAPLDHTLEPIAGGPRELDHVTHRVQRLGNTHHVSSALSKRVNDGAGEEDAKVGTLSYLTDQVKSRHDKPALRTDPSATFTSIPKAALALPARCPSARCPLAIVHKGGVLQSEPHSGSLESDGFVIIDANAADLTTSLMKGRANGKRSRDHTLGLGTQRHTFRSSALISATRPAEAVPDASPFMQPPAEALRVIERAESATWRAILIASLGDAKAVEGLAIQSGHNGPLLWPICKRPSPSSPRDDDSGSDLHGVQAWPGAFEHLTGFVPERSKKLPLLVDALVLYLKALTVIGAAIGDLSELEADCEEGRRDRGQSTLLSGAIAQSRSGGSRHLSLAPHEQFPASERIVTLHDWLETHFEVVLGRAQECRKQVEATAVEEETVAPLHALFPRRAEELLYRRALKLAKEGAVKELLGQSVDSLEHYAQAKSIMEAILAEPSLPMEDQRVLERYTADLEARLEELNNRGYVG